MLQELHKFYDRLKAEKAEVLGRDVESIVAVKVQEYAKQARAEVETEIKAAAVVLDIKMEAILDAIKVVELNTAPEESVEEAPVFEPATTETTTI